MNFAVQGLGLRVKCYGGLESAVLELDWMLCAGAS